MIEYCQVEYGFLWKAIRLLHLILRRKKPDQSDDMPQHSLMEPNGVQIRTNGAPRLFERDLHYAGDEENEEKL